MFKQKTLCPSRTRSLKRKSFAFPNRIGLAVCRTLIDIMGGDIVLDDSYESGIQGSPGARFEILTNRSPLSLEDEDALVDQNESNRAFPPSNQEKAVPSNAENTILLPDNCSVLFVDDDTMLRRLFSRSLSKLKPQWSIQEASNGETAIELVTSGGPYDIIFMDQYMASPTKQLLGTETVRALRARGVKSLICGLSANDMLSAFEEAGADALMLKP